MDAPTPAPAASTSESRSPLSAEDLRLLSAARAYRSGVRTAAGLASLNGWSLAFAGVVSLAAAAVGFGSVWLALLLIAFGVVELRGRRLLFAYDPAAVNLLAGNQIALLLAVWVYCGVSAYQGQSTDLGVSEKLGEMRELVEVMRLERGVDLDAQVAGVDAMVRRGLVLFYTSLAAVALIFQGGCAYYYYTRRASLEAMQVSPAWVRELVAAN